MASKICSIRLNEEEYQLLSDKANSCDEKLSTYLKSIAKHEAVGSRCIKKADKELVTHLANIAGVLSGMMSILPRELNNDNLNDKMCELLHHDLYQILVEINRLGDRYDC